MARITVILLGVMALAGGSPAAAATDAEGSGRLVVKGKYVDTGMTYFEGALQYLVIKRRSTGTEVLRRRGRVRLNKALPRGRYRLVSYTRACVGICPPRDPKPCTDDVCPGLGGLAGPTDRCAKNFRMSRGETLKTALRVGVGIPCRITFSAHQVRIRGATDADEGLARELRRYLHRNAGSARWYHALRTIEAERGVFTVHTTLLRRRQGRTAADQICNLIQGSDLADFTPGHTVRGQHGKRIAVCPARRK